MFSLKLKRGSDEIQQYLEEKEPKLTGSEDAILDDSNYTFSEGHTSKYGGPITRSRTKG